MDFLGYPLIQLAALSLLVAMILGIAVRLNRMFPPGTYEAIWIVIAIILGGFMLIFGILLSKTLGALTGALIVILVWIIGESIHAGRERKRNESQ
ncbi:MAG TPA: hypothetical protein VLB83_05700 [Candidatus Paceibacterota bacterium]|nr:hypothetical protein [Candidatus Paceibacterota bacterium]